MSHTGMTAYDEARLGAATKFIARTGAMTWQLRYSDDEQPVVWMAIGGWKRSGRVDMKSPPPWVVEHQDGTPLPNGSCGKLDPEATR